MDQEKVGNLIKKLRLDNNLTQKELADKLNVTFQAVSKWENGKSVPDIAQLHEISKLFNIDISEILDGELKEKKKKKTGLIIAGIIIIIAVTTCILLINKNNNFAFKKITTNDSGYNITGSLAYDSKGKIYIYITDIESKSNDDTKYKDLKVSLYENYNGTNTKIKDCEEEGHNTTIKEHLKNVTFNIDDYKSSCSDLTKSNFYLEVSATNEEDKTIYYKINLELEDICPVE